MSSFNICSSRICYYYYFVRTSAPFSVMRTMYSIWAERHCINSPVIVLIYEEVRAAFVDHRLNREHHTWNEKHLTSLWCHIADKRIFMEFQTDTVSADILYDRVSVCTGMCIDRICDITILNIRDASEKYPSRIVDTSTLMISPSSRMIFSSGMP